MTHYKNHWMQLLANRLKEQKRVIIKKDIYPNFLCFCIKNGLGGIEVKTTCAGESVIINKL